MFLHLGGETVIRNDEILGIFDLDKTSTGPITREFLRRAEEELRVTAVSQDLPRSFVLCRDNTGERIYLSPIAPATLRRRAERGLFTAKEEQHP